MASCCYRNAILLMVKIYCFVLRQKVLSSMFHWYLAFCSMFYVQFFCVTLYFHFAFVHWSAALMECKTLHVVLIVQLRRWLCPFPLKLWIFLVVVYGTPVIHLSLKSPSLLFSCFAHLVMTSLTVLTVNNLNHLLPYIVQAKLVLTT